MSQRDNAPESDPLAPVRTAVGCSHWQEAQHLLQQLDPRSARTAAALELRAQAAYGNGELEACVVAWEELHALSLSEGDRAEAARAAAMVALHLLMDTGLMATVRGWLVRAERLLTEGGDSPADAVVPMVRGYERFLCGDMDTARSQAALAVERGERLGVTPAVVLGKVCSARVRIADGDMPTGLDELDEVAALLMAGGADDLTTGIMYCELICAAQWVGLHDRASEWTDVMDRWRHSAALGGTRGRSVRSTAGAGCTRPRCCASRDRVRRRRRRRCGRVRSCARGCAESLAGRSLVELGTIRLRKGDLEGAEEAFGRAHEHAWSPQPGLALLRLEQGDVSAAAEMIADAIAHPVAAPFKELPPYGDLRLAPLWDAQARIADASGDVETAREAARSLVAVAATYPTRILAASAVLAQGRAALVAGEPADAIDCCSRAVAESTDLGAPFEAAVARTVLARAHEMSGHLARACEEWEAAHASFTEFGASRWARYAHDAGSGATTSSGATTWTASGVPPGDGAVRAGFRCRGDIRTVDFAGTTAPLRDLTGLRHLARLLVDPGREFHALDLVSLERGDSSVGRVAAPLAARDDGLVGTPEAVGAGLPVLDDQARDAYRRRLTEIEEDIEEAVRLNDPTRTELAERDRDFLVAELTRAVGLDGRQRTTGGGTERARTSVTRSIRYALGVLARQHPAAATHLRQCVRTGAYCCYEPDPLTPVEWQI